MHIYIGYMTQASLRPDSNAQSAKTIVLVYDAFDKYTQAMRLCVELNYMNTKRRVDNENKLQISTKQLRNAKSKCL